jgi:subtilase family serine protease
MKASSVAALVSVAAVATAAHAIPISQTAVVSSTNTSEQVNFKVFLPLRNQAALDQLLVDQQNKASPSYHKWLTPSDFAARFGPTQDSFNKVSAALAAQGLTVTGTHTQSLDVTGTAGTVQKAFATRLQTVTPRFGPHRFVAATPLALPGVLQQQGAVVIRFAGLPEHQVHARKVSLASPDNRYSNVGGYWFTDLKQAYGYPSYQAKVRGKRLDGTGVSVAVLMTNDVLDSDVQAAFDHEKFTAVSGQPAPKVNRLLVNGGAPFDPNASAEASLDVQEVLGGAPGAKVTLVNIPTLGDSDIMDGYETIVENNTFDIVNSSFGGCELFYTAAYNGGEDFTYILKQYEAIFKQGNAQGITFVASSGDSGGLGCTTADYFNGSSTAHFIPGVESPADSPSVTAVGGTNLITTTPPSPQTTPPALNSAYVAENAYGDPEIPYDPYGVGVNVSGGYWGAGGGVSQIFSKPPYQLLANTGSSGRTLPDVGMQVGGCPGGISVQPCGPNRSYVIIFLGGEEVGLIGTSVASPEFVSAVALFEENLGGRVGNLNNYLYTAGAVQSVTGGLLGTYHRYIPGFDGKYDNNFPNGAKYDYLVGNGTPKVQDLFLMIGAPAAGVPQTPSNP